MNKQKSCPICGILFTPYYRTEKYCSDVCRKAGAKVVRARWEQDTGYREKMRLYAQKRRERAKLEKESAAAETKASKEKRIAFSVESYRKQFEERCDSGDPFALMLKARRDGDELEYWNQFARYEREYADSSGRPSTRTVNGISIYDEDFAEKVIAVGYESCLFVSTTANKKS